MNQNIEHLRLLGLFHYIVGGLIALFSCIPIVHLILGIVLLVVPEKVHSNGELPPPVIGWLFIIFAGGMIAIGLIIAALIIFAGRFLRQQRRYRYCFVMACVECIFMPFGTVLGIFSLIALNKPAIKALFASPATAPAASV